MTEIVFDSSFLMAVVDTPTTWFDDIVERLGKFDPLLPECVFLELQKLAAGRDKRSRTARVAVDISKGFKRLPCGSARVDDEVISEASARGAFVATTDAVLASAARGAHLRVVSLRGGRVDVA